MEFSRSVHHNWSPKKYEKWNEWINQYSDDEIVIEGAKAVATEKSLILSGYFSILVAFASFCYITINLGSSMFAYILSIIPIICMFFIIRFIVYIFYKHSGMKNYYTRKDLFKAGLNSLSMKFHHKGVAKHKAIEQKRYEESRRSNKKR